MVSHPSPGVVLPSSQYPTVGVVTNPSPQISEHTLVVVASPNVHSHFDSTAHRLLQPSLFKEFPSSQYPAVGVTTNPSPQRSLQVLAVVGFPPEHSQLDSTVQVESHPSPEVVPPSSQYVAAGVGGIIFPSPQSSEHELAVVESPKVHVQSVSSLHVASHPSPGVVFPSSQ